MLLLQTFKYQLDSERGLLLEFLSFCAFPAPSIRGSKAIGSWLVSCVASVVRFSGTRLEKNNS